MRNSNIVSSEKPVFKLAEELGASLAAYRLARNMSQSDVAGLAGLDRTVVVRMEAGRGGTVDSLIRILKALGVEDRIPSLLPDATMSPLGPERLKGPRKRASKPRKGG